MRLASLYTLVTSFTFVTYATFPSQSNVPFSKSHCVNRSGSLSVQVYISPEFLYGIFPCCSELNICDACEQAKACIMSSEGRPRCMQ